MPHLPAPSYPCVAQCHTVSSLFRDQETALIGTGGLLSSPEYDDSLPVLRLRTSALYDDIYHTWNKDKSLQSSSDFAVSEGLGFFQSAVVNHGIWNIHATAGLSSLFAKVAMPDEEFKVVAKQEKYHGSVGAGIRWRRFSFGVSATIIPQTGRLTGFEDNDNLIQSILPSGCITYTIGPITMQTALGGRLWSNTSTSVTRLSNNAKLVLPLTLFSTTFLGEATLKQGQNRIAAYVQVDGYASDTSLARETDLKTDLTGTGIAISCKAHSHNIPLNPFMIAAFRFDKFSMYGSQADLRFLFADTARMSDITFEAGVSPIDVFSAGMFGEYARAESPITIVKTFPFSPWALFSDEIQYKFAPGEVLMYEYGLFGKFKKTFQKNHYFSADLAVSNVDLYLEARGKTLKQVVLLPTYTDAEEYRPLDKELFLLTLRVKYAFIYKVLTLELGARQFVPVEKRYGKRSKTTSDGKGDSIYRFGGLRVSMDVFIAFFGE